MPTNSDLPTHCLYCRALGAEQWRMFAYFDDLTEDECEKLRKFVEYESAPHNEEVGDEFTAVWEPSGYEFKCIEQTGHVALRSKLESDKRELDRLVSGQQTLRDEDTFTPILRAIALRNKNQVHTAICRIGKDGDSESDREGPPEAESTATSGGMKADSVSEKARGATGIGRPQRKRRGPERISPKRDEQIEDSAGEAHTGDVLSVEATSDVMQSEPNAPIIREDENTEHDTPPGEWSLKMTGAEAARRLTGKENARFRDVEPSLEDTGFERIPGTNKVRIRLDTLSPEDRNKIQNPAKTSTIFDHDRPS